MRHSLKTLLALAVLLVPLAACGGDDGGGGDNAGSIQAYCDFSASLDEQSDFPSESQLDQLRDVAPSEIEDDIDAVVDRFEEVGEDEEALGELFSDEEFSERIERIEAFEERECGREPEE